MSAGAFARALELKHSMVDAGLLPNGVACEPDFDKPAGEKCPHQRFKKGCRIYERRPFGCRMWNCRWLVNDDCNELPRPDRAHYVLDISPDFVRNGEQIVPVIQVWLDAGFPDAHRDPKLRIYLERRAREGYAALVRIDAVKAILLVAPALSPDGNWLEIEPQVKEQEHTALDKWQALGPLGIGLTDG